MAKRNKRTQPRGIAKCPTGIRGVDEITEGGLPRERPTLVCGGAGSGKTLFGMEFLVRGALEFDEPGVCLSFEENAEDLTANIASLGFDLNEIRQKQKLAVVYIRIERSEIEEAGEYDLEGLFIRLGHAIDSIGAKRVLLDSFESLFAGLRNEAVLRGEIRRLFRWLKDRKVTAVVTGERGDGSLTRHGLEEYISDCVISLDHEADQAVFTRRLRVIKYRGSSHGTNEYPFLIGSHGISVFPLTSLGLQHAVSKDRISSGVPALDEMLEGKGFFRGSTILISGTAGTGKTSAAAHLSQAACSRGERILYCGFEESSGQFVRNMESIGLKFQKWLDSGLLNYWATRPTSQSVEMHLVEMYRRCEDLQPRVVVIDPISSLLAGGSERQVRSVLLRIIDFLKTRGITCFMTSLTEADGNPERTETNISSLVDTWLLLREMELAGERNRTLYVLKSRGMAHSNQVREFLLTADGIELCPAYLGVEGVLTGSARKAQEAADRIAELSRQQDLERERVVLDRRRRTLEAQLAALQAEIEVSKRDIERLEAQEKDRRSVIQSSRAQMQTSRQAGGSRQGISAKKARRAAR